MSPIGGQDRAEDAFVREIENSLRNEGGLARLAVEADVAEDLPGHPFRFVLYYLQFYKWPLIAMALLELGQASCQILIPKAVQSLIDAASQLTDTAGVSVWTALADPMKFFVALNVGILLCS